MLKVLSDISLDHPLSIICKTLVDLAGYIWNQLSPGGIANPFVYLVIVFFSFWIIEEISTEFDKPLLLFCFRLAKYLICIIIVIWQVHIAAKYVFII